MSALSELASSPPKLKWWRPFSKNITNNSNNNAQTPSALDPYGASIPFGGHGAYNKPAASAAMGWPERGKAKNGKPTVFGAKLEDSMRLASVAISMIGPDKRAYIYGFIPVVVAKCGLYLKENATTTEGIFRISGSTKRMRELQTVFDNPPAYGKDLDWKWTGPEGHVPGQEGKTYYSVHDAANVLRRFLVALPEPLIPYTMYKDFRSVLTKHSSDSARQVHHFRVLISTLPDRSQHLLLYLLDLLAVFARKSSANLMTASNLAVVFQPGLCSPPPPQRRHSPSASTSQEQEAIVKEVKDAQQVLGFLIENQHAFVMGLSPHHVEPRPPSASAPALVPALKHPSPHAPAGAGGAGATDVTPPRHVRVAAPPSLSSDDDGNLALRSQTDLSRWASERSEHSRRRKIKKERKEKVVAGGARPRNGSVGGTAPPTGLGGVFGLKRSRTLPTGGKRSAQKPGRVGSPAPGPSPVKANAASPARDRNIAPHPGAPRYDASPPEPQPSRRYQTAAPSDPPTPIASAAAPTASPLPAGGEKLARSTSRDSGIAAHGRERKPAAGLAAPPSWKTGSKSLDLAR